MPDVHQIGEPALLVHEKDRSAAVAESVQRLQSGQLDAECESLGGRVADRARLVRCAAGTRADDQRPGGDPAVFIG